MRFRQARGVLWAGLAVMLHAVTVSQAACQGTYLARLAPGGAPPSALKSMACKTRGMTVRAVAPGSLATPAGEFCISGLRVATPAEILRTAILLSPPGASFSLGRGESYFSMPVFEEMESSFRTQDTPFVSVVRLSLGTMWRGRIRLAWFADTRSLDNVILGPPVAGVLNAARLAGGGTLQFEEDTYGVLLMFRIRRSVPGPEERDALRGLQRAYRTGRGHFLQ